jgi:hypothetical protein
MYIQPVNNFHAFLHEELDNIRPLHFHEKWHYFGIAWLFWPGLAVNGLDGTE